jgi:hypothetical protein
MVDTGYIKPINKIVLSGSVQSVEMEVENATNMYPGRLVMHGATNNEVVVSDGTAIVYGWLGYEQAAVMYKPATVDTIYVAGDRAPVIHGPGMILVGAKAGSQTIVMGDKLQAAADGLLAKWVPIVESSGAANTEQQVVAIAMEDGASADAGDLIVRSLI